MNRIKNALESFGIAYDVDIASNGDTYIQFAGKNDGFVFVTDDDGTISIECMTGNLVSESRVTLNAPTDAIIAAIIPAVAA